MFRYNCHGPLALPPLSGGRRAAAAPDHEREQLSIDTNFKAIARRSCYRYSNCYYFLSLKSKSIRLSLIGSRYCIVYGIHNKRSTLILKYI